MRILITEMAGRASVELKAAELGVDLTSRPEVVSRVVETVKEREAAGWSFEAADASFLLLLRRELDRPGGPGGAGGPGGDGVADGADDPVGVVPFRLESYRVIVEHSGGSGSVGSVNNLSVINSEATVKVHVAGQRVIATAEGNGPVNALDSALRQAIVSQYPRLADVELTDYKVRILAGHAGTDSVTRVLVTSADASGDWTTVGVHANVVEASFQALLDSLVYALDADGVTASRPAAVAAAGA
jgi:2-isopropylmalate synthase